MDNRLKMQFAAGRYNQYKAFVDKQRQERHLDGSKASLSTKVGKRITTTMIGSLEAIEKSLGYLWGAGEKNLSPEQKELKAKWEELRTTILNLGNNQKRLILNELGEFTVSWNKFNFKSVPINVSKEDKGK